LSSFLYRLAFNEVFTQAVNSEVKSQVFLSKSVNGFSFGGMAERYQNFFQTIDPTDGLLSNPPTFDSIRILHTPSADASSVDRPLSRSPFFWSFDASMAGLARSEPGFHTGTLLGLFDFSPEISLPLQFLGWSVRPALTLHETYYARALCERTCCQRSHKPAGFGDFGGSAASRSGEDIRQPISRTEVEARHRTPRRLPFCHGCQ
jgi:LPS-assembly protein